MYKEKEKVVMKNETKNVVNENYLFLGDSITDYYDLDKYFPGYPVVNIGVSGDKTKSILDDMYNRVYRYNPSKIILLIGINNFLHENATSSDVFSAIEEITDKIEERLPNAKIYIESIYPVNDDWRRNHNNNVPPSKKVKKEIDETNENLEKLSKEKNYIYIDLNSKLSDEKGYFDKEYTDDGLHPNENGYEKITEELKKVLNL